MPSLTWPSKHLLAPQAAALIKDSIIHPDGRGYPGTVPESRLILGDNLAVMAALLPEYEGRLNLIYADPPFFTNRKFSARIGRGEDSRRPNEWILTEGYPDAWPNLDAYLDFLYQRLALMYRLLAPNGTLYLHLDWHANSYARILLDEIFGQQNLLNEIIWTYHGPSPIRSAFNRKHDTILAYFKGSNYTFNADAVREPYNPSTLMTFKASPKAGFGKIPNLERGKVPEDWWYFPVVARLHNERTGYPTQKPESMLQRIILASSNPGDFVADFFCGSGTTPVVAARLGRKFIASDITLHAVHTTRRRLVASQAEVFSLERDASFPFPFSDSAKIKIAVEKDLVRIDTPLPLDYWELDPAWDGKIFKSAAQAQRPVRSGEISGEMKMRVPARVQVKTGRRICVRLVTVAGEMFQLVLNV
ncbi:MAG: site-specific DNA-methyltransferase [Chloroflexi bacterium]|nr:site-specific DNA-methyltransferase [Chloroflexota bacterium]MBI3341091.1 site-specific DNA-methyltransferase [Chloroflexota bacterium]